MVRRFQYRLRTLLIVMTVVALPLGWFAYKADKQRRALKALQSSDALSYKFDGSNAKPGFFPWRNRVYSVWLRRQPSDSDIEALQALDGLHQVVVRDEADLTRVRAALPNCSVGTLAIPDIRWSAP